MSSNGGGSSSSSSSDDTFTASGKETSMEETRGKSAADKAAKDASGSTLPGKHTCSKCSYSTRNKILYDNHSCDQQGEESNPEEETVITLKVDEEKKYHCSECDVWGQGHAFEEHLMCHIILRPYQCLYCSKCFVNRREVGRHVVKEHTGMKMNCALRALKRAKGLMKATVESGSFQFYACVAGKVPLPADPEKSKAKQRKSKSDSDRPGGSKDVTKASSEVSSGKPASDNGQNTAAVTDTGTPSSASSSSKSCSDALESNKIPEDLKDPDSGQVAVGENLDKVSLVAETGCKEEAEDSKPQPDQKTSSGEQQDPQTDAEVTFPSSAMDQTQDEKKMADGQEKIKEDSTVHTVTESKPEKQDLDSKPCEEQASTSSTLDSSLKLKADSEQDIKPSDTMDTDCEQDGVFKSTTQKDTKTDLPICVNTADSNKKEENATNSTTKSEETDLANKSSKPEDSENATEASLLSSKTGISTDAGSKTSQSGDSANEDTPAEPVPNSDPNLRLESSADKSPASTGVTDGSDAVAETADTENGTEAMDFAPVVEEERLTPGAKEEDAAESTTEKTTPSETSREEDGSDPLPKTQETSSSPGETEEPMDTSPSLPNSTLEGTTSNQPESAASEKICESAETNMEIDSCGVSSKEKVSTEEEDGQSSVKTMVSAGENDPDSCEKTISPDAENDDNMEVEETDFLTEKDKTITSTPDTAESEDASETSRNINLDPVQMETNNDLPKEDGKEAVEVKDADFPSANFDQSEEEESEMGLKIVAAFSLQDDGPKDSGDSTPQTAKAGSETESPVEADANTNELPQEEADAASETSSIHRMLGPPSKPVPSSSFLGVIPSAEAITSQGGSSSGQIALQNCCFFFVCGFGCGFSCLTSPEFRDHLMLDHAGESSFRCFHCGFQSPSEDGLVRHISAHAHTYSKSVPLYICGASACKFGSNLVNDFITHQSAWHPELTVFHCHDCDERFDSVEELLQHFEANFLHIINCPHCTAKSTERRTLLNHITAAHPGKPKMVSVAKQIVCRDRKLNGYAQFLQAAQNQTAAAMSVVSSCTADQSGASHSRTKSLVSILTQPIQPQERELTRKAQALEQARQASAASANLASVKLESVENEEEDDFFQENFEDSFDEEEYGIQSQGQATAIAYMGSKREDREVDNFKCQFCTFIARDRCRLDGHERCHGLPPSRKSRFKCMYCPQGFNNEHKFSSHVSCHPGLIKFSLYCCKYCEFDSNQRHIIVKHVRSTRDQVHMINETDEESMYAVLSKSMESRVLECAQCSYMTRHRKHLVAHLKREHSSLRKTGITVDCDIVEKYPSQSIGAGRNKALEMALSHDLAAQLPVGDDVFVRENQARRFKCPICQYLVPRAADLKAHVKRHSEIGEITLVMFRCKYCSAASTAREIIYGHLMEKHLGKQIALVKRIVTIDTKGNDNGYAVTSVEDEDGQGGDSQGLPEGGDNSAPCSSKAVLVIPDSAGETLTSLMQCPSCAFGSYSRKTIIQHVSNHHPEVRIMGRRQDSELYPLETTYTTPATAGSATTSAAHFTLGESLKGEILIVPDSQTFEEAVLCPKCDYATIHRRNIVQHLEQNHPEVSVMGRNDYPTFDGKSQAAVDANATGKDGMVIIGSGSLDEKIRCLYENFGDRMKCMICQAERPKKFFIHVHILRHLNILLWGCQFCSHKGLQKYKMMDHIKKVHPGRAFCIRYLPVNVEERVNQYLQNASMIRARRSGEEGGDPPQASQSPSLPVSFPSSSSSSSGGDGDLNALRMKYKASQDRLSGCTIGSEELDMKLACLYSVGSDNRYRCVVCGQEFQRKFAVHRHIVQAHLKVNLLGCGYCDLEGVERHIMMDHIIETHKSAPISMRNLAQNLEDKVAEFLNRMTLSADDAVADLVMDGEFKLPEPPQVTFARETTASPPPPSRTPSPSPSRSGGGKNQLNPNLLLLGRDILHQHLACMIRESGSSFCCQVCKWDFPRKYAVHRHILMKHLKLGIIGCPYCSFEGVERYQVFTHIREEHKDAELSLRYLSLDLQSQVAQYLEGVANGTLDVHSRATPPWSMKKVPKKEVVSDNEEEEEEEDSSQDNPPTTFEGGSGGGRQGLVVAMFGNKKSSFTIKEEPRDDEDDALGQEPLDREVNSEESGLSYDRYLGDLESSGDREVSSTSLLAANGTKAKVATDVQTNIRVITIKEKGFKRHICEKCKFTSLHRSNIVRHIYRVHEQYREHECPACNYKTLSRVLIEQHVANEHPGVPLPEIASSKGVKRKVDMSREELEYDSMKKCKAAATSKRREADLPLLNSASTQLYACAYCNFETMTHAQIVQHTRDKHSLLEAMKTEDENEASQHGDSSQDGAAFEKAINTMKLGPEGLSVSQDDSLWQCFYCSFKTPAEEELKNHFAEMHPGSVYRAKRVPAWRFVCRSCHVKTRAHSKMRYHLNRHINYRPYTCTTCGAFYPSPDQCRKHCRANSHNETFTYVKIPRKERRLQELLKECQEIAAALVKNPALADATPPSSTLSQPVPSKRKAKKSFSAHSRATPSKMRKNYEYDAPYSPRGGSGHGHREDRPKEDGAVMVCASCDFSAQNVCDVWLHFIKEHEEQEFRWLDSSNGYICTETGEITNGKDVSPDLEAPPGPGYTTMSSRLLSCEHCEFTTSTVQAMKSHLRRHLPKRYLCPYCSLRCSRRDTINQHVRCGHRGRELWTIFFRLPDGFAADSDNAESNLAEDGQSSTAGGIVKSQERIRCGQCDVRLYSVAAVLKHHNEDHAELDFLWIDLTKGYTCNQSGEVTDAKELSPQLFTQDGYTKEEDGNNVSTFCCKFCPFTSAFVQAIKSHMKSHLPHGFMCPYCCMNTNSKEKMIAHQTCMHREHEPWILHLRMLEDSSSLEESAVVPESSDASSESNTLRGVTQYSCNECQFASENLYQYRMHLANHGSFPHLVKDASEELPFRCGYCVYVAEDEGDFGAHIASHLERRNFRCSKCEFAAFNRSAVQTHIQTTHDETEEIDVVDLQAREVSQLAGSVEEPHLVNLEPKVKVRPVNDLDLDREGLTLFSPPPTPDEEGQESRGQEGNVVRVRTSNVAELDNQSDSTEEWGGGGGGNDEEEEEASVGEGSPEPAQPSQALPRSGNSILRLTLQGKLTGEYGIKRAVPVDEDGRDLTDASGSEDSSLSAGNDPALEAANNEEEEEEDGSLEQADSADVEEEEEEEEDQDMEVEDDDDDADEELQNDRVQSDALEMEENEDEEEEEGSAEVENEDYVMDVDSVDFQSLDQPEGSVGFEPLEEEDSLFTAVDGFPDQ